MRKNCQVVMVERSGKPAAVVIPVEMDEVEREARFEVLERVRSLW